MPSDRVLRSAALLGAIVVALGGWFGGGPDWAGAVHIPVSNLQLTVNSGAPTALPKEKRVPVDFTFGARVRTLDGSHPPAMTELTLDLDRDLQIDAAGLPVCPPTILDKRELADIRRACAAAVVGSGLSAFDVAFPESSPMTLEAKLIVVNGGSRGNVTSLYLLDEIMVPTPAVIRMPMKVESHPSGPYGSTATISIPTIAGGWGSIFALSFTLPKKTINQDRPGPVSLRCWDGTAQLGVNARFSNGELLTSTLLRKCVGRPRVGG